MQGSTTGGFGTKARRGLFGGTLFAALAFALAAAPGNATVFDIGKPERVGTFKVLGGDFKQNVSYLANYKFETSDGCWVYNYSDQGSASFDLTFDRGEVDRWKWTGTDLPPALFASGKASRSWSGTVNVEATPKEDRDDCAPADPLTDNNRSCGSTRMDGERTGFTFVPVKGGRIATQGDDLAPFGPVLERDPFRARGTNNCPSASVYGLTAIPAITKDGMRKLDRAKVGEKVELRGRANESGPGPDGFAVFGDWVSGSQTAEMSWELRLKRIKPRR